jgi:hypothetical protein
VRENVSRLNRYYNEKEAAAIRQQYRQVNDDEMEALKVQMQLRERIKLRTGDK